MFRLPLGYFLAYLPYAMLVKALSSGVLPGVPAPSGALMLLPAAALGQLAVMPVLLAASGWWRHARRRRLLGLRVIAPGRETMAAGFFCALIIATTTANLAFVGASVLLVLLLMRGGVLILSPLMDAARRRRIHGHSWAALALSLTAVAVALGDVKDLRMPRPLLLGLALYLIGYTGRFEIMSRTAKTGVIAIDRRYLAEEHATAPVFQVVLLAAAALAGVPDLREGFTAFLTTPTAAAAVAVGVAYEVLFVFGTLIYLDAREYSWCVPANRCASLLAGLVASYALVRLAGMPAPGPAQLAAFVLILGAITALSAPTLSALLLAHRRRDQRTSTGTRAASRLRLLFICDGNTSRSAMAAAIARSDARSAATVARSTTTARLLATLRAGPRIQFASGGISVRRPGAPMNDQARAALAELGVPPGRHRARPVSPKLCRTSTAIYCMTQAQRDALLALMPDLRERTFRLDEAGDVPNPSGHSPETYARCAHRIRHAVRARLTEHLGPALCPDGRTTAP
ncbi:hypothetical protein [Actinomadura sp. 9N215]|uniref:arsenate reductase/protein-tyrosine-phosphatase family protein n=1 Tax=Actinomadura sp. 9N215 TaxID=3375150 RepID=UPI0037B865B2